MADPPALSEYGGSTNDHPSSDPLDLVSNEPDAEEDEPEPSVSREVALKIHLPSSPAPAASTGETTVRINGEKEKVVLSEENLNQHDMLKENENHKESALPAPARSRSPSIIQPTLSISTKSMESTSHTAPVVSSPKPSATTSSTGQVSSAPAPGTPKKATFTESLSNIFSPSVAMLFSSSSGTKSPSSNEKDGSGDVREVKQHDSGKTDTSLKTQEPNEKAPEANEVLSSGVLPAVTLSAVPSTLSSLSNKPRSSSLRAPTPNSPGAQSSTSSYAELPLHPLRRPVVVLSDEDEDELTLVLPASSHRAPREKRKARSSSQVEGERSNGSEEDDGTQEGEGEDYDEDDSEDEEMEVSRMGRASRERSKGKQNALKHRWSTNYASGSESSPDRQLTPRRRSFNGGSTKVKLNLRRNIKSAIVESSDSNGNGNNNDESDVSEPQMTARKSSRRNKGQRRRRSGSFSSSSSQAPEEPIRRSSRMHTTVNEHGYREEDVVKVEREEDRAMQARMRKYKTVPSSSEEEDAVESGKEREKRVVVDFDTDDDDEDDDGLEILGEKEAEDGDDDAGQDNDDDEGDDDDDGEDDNEDGPWLHRDFCEKCDKPPAAELIAKAIRRAKKYRNKRKGSRDNDDEDLMSEDEEISRMGGWAQCGVCRVAAHFGCLGPDQKKQLLLKPLDGSKRIGPDPKETVTFVCARCKVDSRCMVCALDSQDAIDEIEKECMRKVDESVRLSDEYLDKLEEEERGTQNVGDGDVEMVDVEGSNISKDLPVNVDGSSPPPQANTSNRSQQGDDDIFVPSLPKETPLKTASNANLGDEMDVHGANEGGDQNKVQNGEEKKKETEQKRMLLFRCKICKRAGHYTCLPDPTDEGWKLPGNKATLYSERDWVCVDCERWQDNIGFILAWRPWPSNAKEKYKPGEIPPWKEALPREYLVKWEETGFRKCEWVPHQVMSAKFPGKLRNFLEKGSAIELSELVSAGGGGAVDQGTTTPDEGAINAEDDTVTRSKSTPKKYRESDDAPPQIYGPSPLPRVNAEAEIPKDWVTFDRVMDIYMKYPPGYKVPKKTQKGSRKLIDSDEGLPILDWEKFTKSKISHKNHLDVLWAFVKCRELPYSTSLWEKVPSPDEPELYDAFKMAYIDFLKARTVVIPPLSRQDRERRDREARSGLKFFKTQPTHLKGGTLMQFQLEGLNWLVQQWKNARSCILADDMGLGKTVQIVSFVATLTKNNIYPHLITVPNSTITNWVREFQKWAPDVRVVPYYGGKESKDIVESMELFHPGGSGRSRRLKAHVVLTTYEVITSKSFSTIAGVGTWDTLIIDEGQRLKSDSNLIFKNLLSLNAVQRVLMTGTPLNNNIRELFTLLSFLDPNEWGNLNTLESRFTDLNEEKVKELHSRLTPYFLRRIKSEVLKLPPRHEVIVPLSMRPLQKEVYKSILTANLELIQKLKINGVRMSSNRQKATSVANICMQLRKTCQHPYLIDHSIEDLTVSAEKQHKNMEDASCKLLLLKVMLPKLFARGHRVLLFSQFKIVLDIIEDWLEAEGLKYLLLTGDTPQAQRQKDMDKFNAPGSEHNLFLLTTRAGGVGINLATADTVIIFDADYNPHQDLQAISRAHRFGQQKEVLVFKFMVRDTMEEKMYQAAKKKMVLDHVIIQNMKNDEQEDIQSLVTFGARALFDDDGKSQDIVYTERSVEELIENMSKSTDTEPGEGSAGPSGGSAGAMSFGFTKIWDNRDGLEELAEDREEEPADDFWQKLLDKAAAEKDAAEARLLQNGKKRRRKAGISYNEHQPAREEPLDPKAPMAVDDDDNDSNFSASLGSHRSSEGEVENHIGAAIEFMDDNASNPADSVSPEKKKKKRILDRHPPLLAMDQSKVFDNALMHREWMQASGSHPDDPSTLPSPGHLLASLGDGGDVFQRSLLALGPGYPQTTSFDVAKVAPSAQPHQFNVKLPPAKESVFGFKPKKPFLEFPGELIEDMKIVAMNIGAKNSLRDLERAIHPRTPTKDRADLFRRGCDELKEFVQRRGKNEGTPFIKYKEAVVKYLATLYLPENVVESIRQLDNEQRVPVPVQSHPDVALKVFAAASSERDTGFLNSFSAVPNNSNRINTTPLPAFSLSTFKHVSPAPAAAPTPGPSSAKSSQQQQILVKHLKELSQHSVPPASVKDSNVSRSIHSTEILSKKSPAETSRSSGFTSSAATNSAPLVLGSSKPPEVAKPNSAAAVSGPEPLTSTAAKRKSTSQTVPNDVGEKKKVAKKPRISNSPEDELVIDLTVDSD